MESGNFTLGASTMYHKFDRCPEGLLKRNKNVLCACYVI